MKRKKIILYANTAWYLYNFRLALIHALREQGYNIVLIAPGDKYVPRLRAEGIRVITVAMDRANLNPLKELRLVRSLYDIVKREAPDIMYNFTIKCVVYGSLVARLAGIRRRINAVAGLGTVFSSDKASIKFLKPIVKVLLKTSLSGRQARLILQNPDDVTLFTRELAFNSERIALIKGSGVNAERFNITSIREKNTVQPAKVLFASRLLWAKGVAHFVDAARALKVDRRYEFLIAGEPDSGNPDAVPAATLTSWKEQGLVTLLGHVDDMAGLLKQVDLVVLPSVYGEGVPRILVESAASGLPLVAFDVPGCKEIVIDKVNGYLIDKSNPGYLAQAIDSILCDRAIYQSMSDASRRHFLNEFEESSVIERTLSTIESTVVAA